MNLYTHLECSYCGQIYNKSKIQSFCLNDSQPLIARYNLDTEFPKSILAGRPYDMWRYHELLPLEHVRNRVSLREGFSPIHHLQSLSPGNSPAKLFLKDESVNPTGSFKARGLSMAVSKAKELGIQSIAIPTAGNAGSALSAYCAKAGLTAHIFMPENTPTVFQLDCEIMGAKVRRVKGDISDAASMMNQENEGRWFDVSTQKEPFRLEGKKTMGFEIAEQMNWQLPDVIIYPTGGGTGLLGIWKAFQEMKELGWINAVQTRMVAVQNSGCAPVVRAFENRLDYVQKEMAPALTIANGIRVPKPFGDRMIMKTLYESNGTAIAISDDEIMSGIREVAQNEGLFLSPEGGATWAAYHKLHNAGWISDSDTVLMINTGSAYKYAENLQNWKKEEIAVTELPC